MDVILTLLRIDGAQNVHSKKSPLFEHFRSS
jgi:hypothetical protein